MSLKTSGLIETEEMLLRLDVQGRRRVFRELVVAGKKLQLMAIRMAPVDEGNLEHAIKMRPEDGAAQDRDEGGRFMRKEVEVYVDFDVEVPERPGKTVGDYAYEIHEHLFPMGYKNLGERSILKQLTNGDVVVGGGFMTRAADAIDAKLEEALQRVVDDLF